MKKKDKINEKDMYLPEDQKLLDELEASGALTPGITSEGFKKELQIAQIKALLRSRKSFDKADKSTTRFSLVIVAFTIIQIVIALMQFISDNMNSAHAWRSLFITLVLAGFIVFVLYKFNSIIDDK